jgi:hypothetical protein
MWLMRSIIIGVYHQTKRLFAFSVTLTKLLYSGVASSRMWGIFLLLLGFGQFDLRRTLRQRSFALGHDADSSEILHLSYVNVTQGLPKPHRVRSSATMQTKQRARLKHVEYRVSRWLGSYSAFNHGSLGSVFHPSWAVLGGIQTVMMP